MGAPAREGSIVIPPSWLGDAVLSFPALHEIARLGPMTLVAHPRVAPILALDPGLGRVEVFAGPALSLAAWRQGARLRALRAERAIVFPRSLSSALRAAATATPVRIGIDAEGRGALLTKRVRLPWPERSRHIAEEFALVADAAGARHPDGVPRLMLAEGALAAARSFLGARGAGPGVPLVALGPGASYGPAKRWPPARFGEIAQRAAASGALPILLGGATDREDCAEVAARSRGARVLDLSGATDIATLAALLALSRVAVTNDSGPMHLAAAVGTPVVGLFGSTNPDWTAPLGPRHAVLRHDVACSPCYRRACPIGLLCFEGISVDAVWSAVEQRLSVPINDGRPVGA